MASSVPADLRVAIEGTSGGIGNAIGLLGTYPLTVIKTRLQSQRKKRHKRKPIPKNEKTGGNKDSVDEHDLRKDRDFKSADLDISEDEPEGMIYEGPLDCIRKVIANEGLGSMYTGVALKPHIKNHLDGPFSDIAHGMIAGNIKIYQYLKWTRNIDFTHNKNWNTAGALSACGNKHCAHNQAAASRRKNDKSPGSSGALQWVREYINVTRDIYREGGGISAFWKGISAGLMLTINPGILTLIRKHLTRMVSEYRGRGATATDDFWIGFASKLMASTITYPLVVARSQIVTSQDSMPHSGVGIHAILRGICMVFETIQRVINDYGGWQGLYAGVAPHLCQAALKEAIANTIRRRLSLILFAYYSHRYSKLSRAG
eukprot:jgi/Bigna1/86741/estExt_fgenesh1_pg.C_130138